MPPAEMNRGPRHNDGRWALEATVASNSFMKSILACRTYPPQFINIPTEKNTSYWTDNASIRRRQLHAAFLPWNDVVLVIPEGAVVALA